MRLSSVIARIENALARRSTPTTPEEAYQRHTDNLRARGVRIGHGCWILSREFSTEPWLIEIGNRVAIAGGVQFVTHEAGAWLLREQYPGLQVFGRITIGDGCIIGMNAILLPGTRVGAGCIVGAGAVVKGDYPPGMVLAGNPARLIKPTQDYLDSLRDSPHRLDVFNLPPREREARIRAHFGLDTAPVTALPVEARPRGPLR